jgi:hypothetical protein
MLKWISEFFSAGNGNASSKRLVKIASTISAIGIGWYCTISGHPLDTNVLILVTALAGISTGSYILTNKNEITKPDIVNTINTVVASEKVPDKDDE